MARLLIPLAIVAIVLLAALIWARLQSRLARLEQEIENLRSELLFLQGELEATTRRLNRRLDQDSYDR